MMRTTILSTLAGTAAFFAASCTTDTAARAWKDELEPGPHAVGFRTEEIFRPAPNGTGTRRLTLCLWYPASRESRNELVSVEDLFRIVLDEGQLAEAKGAYIERAFAAAMTGNPESLPVERARAALDAPTRSRRDAPSASGRFPLAVWGVRHATVLAQAPMAEILASRGWVVATVWSSDPPLAFLWEDHDSEEKRATIEAHAEDLRHALDTLRAEPFVDGDRILALAWSYGGQTAARLQEREDAVRAVVSLDANVVPDHPDESLRLQRPLVWLLGEDATRRGLEAVEELDAPWIVLRVPALAHGNFNALEGFLPALYGAEGVFPWSRGGDVAIEGYGAVVRIVAETAAAFTEEAIPPAPELAERLESAAGALAVSVRYAEPPR